MEEKLRALHAKTVELETQLQVESRAKRSQQEANKKMANEEGNMRIMIADLQGKVEKTESERMRMEAEARDSSDQLREMAEKVFQLLERLKLVCASVDARGRFIVFASSWTVFPFHSILDHCPSQSCVAELTRILLCIPL